MAMVHVPALGYVAVPLDGLGSLVRPAVPCSIPQLEKSAVDTDHAQMLKPPACVVMGLRDHYVTSVFTGCGDQHVHLSALFLMVQFVDKGGGVLRRVVVSVAREVVWTLSLVVSNAPPRLSNLRTEHVF